MASTLKRVAHPHKAVVRRCGVEVSEIGQLVPLGIGGTRLADERPLRTGWIITIVLHLLLVAIYLTQPKLIREKMAEPAATDIVWVAMGQNRPQEQTPLRTVAPTPRKSAPERVSVQRLPNTITLPNEKPVELAKMPAQKEAQKEAQQEVDMQAYIDARRRQRGVQAPSPEPGPAAEDIEARIMRNAMANLAADNNRGRNDRNESGGAFIVFDKKFHSMGLKFRGWNPHYKRRWLTQLTVEQGSEPDLETAVVKKMIELIRKEKSGEFEWDSHRLGKVIALSARPQDTAELQAFLMEEMFPDYKPLRTEQGAPR